MRPLLQAAQLAAAPTDAQGTYDAAQAIKDGWDPASTPMWYEVANLSPYVFEVQDDSTEVLGMVGAFCYGAVRIKAFTYTLVLHKIGTSTTLPIAAADYKVDTGVTRFAPIGPGLLLAP